MMDVEQGQPDGATKAFTEVRDKLAGLTRAVDSMAGEWKALEIPDYSKTLEKLVKEMKANAAHLDAMSENPALQLTPQSLSDAIIKAGEAARAGDHVALLKVTTALETETRALCGALAGARSAEDQRKLLHRMVFGGAVAGALFWATCAGFIARTLPENWLLPERMAARTLRLNMWEAGGRLMATSNADEWDLIVAASRITSKNRAVIQTCVRTATKRHAPTLCPVEVLPEVAN